MTVFLGPCVSENIFTVISYSVIVYFQNVTIITLNIQKGFIV